MKVVGLMLIATFITLVFRQMLDNWSEASINNRSGVLFLISMFMYMFATGNVILIFPDERDVFFREQASGMYSPTSYYLAKVASEIPGFIIFPSLFSLIAYFGLGLNTEDASHYFIFVGYLILYYSSASAQALIVSAWIKDKEVAMTMSPVLNILFMLFSGYFVNQDNIPAILLPIEYVSLIKYGFQVLLYNEYDDLDLGCNGKDPIEVRPSNS